MKNRDDEIVGLWTAIFGGPPPLRTDIPLLIKVLVEQLPRPARTQLVRPQIAAPRADPD